MAFGEQYQQEYECLLFDVDLSSSLYPSSSGLSAQCSKNILEYMVERLGIDEKKVIEMNQFLYKNYGTSMAGLKATGYDFDHDDYHRFVHGRLPYEKLKPDFILRTLLHSLPIWKVVSCLASLLTCMEWINCLYISPMETRSTWPKFSEGWDWRTFSKESYAFETLNNSMDHHSSSYRYIPVIVSPALTSMKNIYYVFLIWNDRSLFFSHLLCLYCSLLNSDPSPKAAAPFSFL